MQTLQTLISNTDWSDIYHCQDVNEAFSKFETHLTKCYEESFPLIRLSRKHARDKKWITTGIKASIKKKSTLYKKWIAYGNDSDGFLFKTYRKIFKSVLKEAENQYFREIFDTKCNSVKQLRSNLNHSFSLSKTKNHIDIPKLCINNVDITEQKQM